jgi:hypothetical protein
MVVAESVKSQILHLTTRQGNVPFCDDESCDGELRARVSEKKKFYCFTTILQSFISYL